MKTTTEITFPTASADQLAEAAELRTSAKLARQRRQESIERSGVSDGFLSQWAHDVTDREDSLKAALLERGGHDVFEGLYRRSDGVRVRAKLIEGRYGWCWAFCDAQDNFTGRFLSDSKGTPRSKLYKLGFEKRDELAPARVKLVGDRCSCTPCVVRADGGYPPNAVVVQ
jgi:hypothetical protein